MEPTSIAEKYSNRRVPFRYDGTELEFYLSLALFSSYDIDTGTKLLMKSLAQQVDFSRHRSLLDIGCGVGVIGLSPAKRHPHLRATLQDRDALAAAFTRANAHLNGISNYFVSADPAFLRLPEREYDLIVSNIPAKAGAPVLEHMIGLMVSSLGGSEHLRAAVVVVDTLEKQIKNMIIHSGGAILHRESIKSHTVFHFAPEDRSAYSTAHFHEERGRRVYDHEAPFSLPSEYFRSSVTPKISGISYSIDTVWGVKNFDTPSFQAQLFGQWASKAPARRDVLVWNPGQGHIPALTRERWASSLRRIDLAGRDSLSLSVSSHNLLFTISSRIFVLPDISALLEELEPGEEPDKGYDTFIFGAEHIPSSRGSSSTGEIWESTSKFLAAGGDFIIIGKSSDLYPFSKGYKHFTLEFTRKQKGYRILVFRYHGTEKENR